MLSNSPSKQPQWPPRSPHEALLGTPGGRERLRHMAEAQTSPTPVRTRPSAGRLGAGVVMGGERNAGVAAGGLDSGTTSHSQQALIDELAELEAKLRLKRAELGLLAKDDAAKEGTRKLLFAVNKDGGGGGRVAGAAATATAAAAAAFGKRALPRPGRATSPEPAVVQVPASPVHRAQPAADAMQKSPRRILLGIDKGLRGQDVSLKRPPVRRAGTGIGGVGGARVGAGSQQHKVAQEQARPLSFNERLAKARNEESLREDTANRIKKIRSSAFTLGRAENEQYKAKAVEIPDRPDQPTAYSRDDVLGTGMRGGAEGSDGRAQQPQQLLPSLPSKRLSAHECPFDDAADKADTEMQGFDPYSGFHLSKRYLPHSLMTRTLRGKTTFSLKDLMPKVKAPDYTLPEVETDVVVFAIVATKSDPRERKVKPPPTGGEEGTTAPGAAGPAKAASRGKFMVLKLVDLKSEVDLYLFDSGFERFWKLTTGTVVAILNPAVIPPPPYMRDTGRWGLVINSDADTILELGQARDLGYCQSKKRDGNLCNAWVNAKRTQFCEYHTNDAVTRSRATRNEINGAAGFGRGLGGDSKGKKAWGGNSKYVKGQRYGGEPYSRKNNGDDARDRHSGYDREAQSQWFIAGGGGGGVGGGGGGGGLWLLDDGDGYADKAERQEGIKRRLQIKEHEMDLARKLAKIGTGAGRDYMKLAADSVSAEDGQRQVIKTATTTTAKTATTTTAKTATTTATKTSTGISTGSSVPVPTTYAAIAEATAKSRASLLASIASRRSVTVGGGGDSSQGQEGETALTASSVRLGGVPKRKRLDSNSGSGGVRSSLSYSNHGAATCSTSASTSAATTAPPRAALGWGKSLAAKLGRMKEGEKLAGQGSIPEAFAAAAAAASAAGRGRAPTAATSSIVSLSPSLVSTGSERSPVRKKTRFFLGDKGIREAGRESLGASNIVVMDDEDDDLVIV